MFSYYARWIPDFSSKIRPLVQSNVSSTFPLPLDASQSFSNLLQDLAAASVKCIQENVPFVVECDASEYAFAATLNQRGQPVAFHSRIFSKSEARYSTVEKEAVAIMDAVHKWSYLLHGKRFTLITDQRAVSFMFDPRRLGKIKNMKIKHGELNLAISTKRYNTGLENSILLRTLFHVFLTWGLLYQTL